MSAGRIHSGRDGAVHLPQAVWSSINQQAREAYPLECCGILVGTARDPTTQCVLRAVAVDNASPYNERRRRYSIPAHVLRSVEERALREELHVVGFYHSHPDRRPVPSDADRRGAWPWFTYLIVSVVDASPASVRSWRLEDDRSRFTEQPLVIQEEES